MTKVKLYEYWRSSAAYRVRIALNLKGIDYQSIPIHLVKNGGEQHSVEFAELNSSELVPVFDDGKIQLNQSLSIIDYLDENYTGDPLTPRSGSDRYLVKSLAQDIAVDIHPLNNLRVLQYLSNQIQVSDEEKATWYRHWVEKGFCALEKKLVASSGIYCVGDSLSLVDVCLIPQVYNALRFNIDMTPFPTVSCISETLQQHPAFVQAEPANQTDAEL
ncbi:maleylacetoacetate isomerase [Vibrio profundum]|uniref:maleylacetoacetate isomerase n=1 Tax=Vibrio profundum TaxID=2910247 RepID=UPI003D11D77D